MSRALLVVVLAVAAWTPLLADPISAVNDLRVHGCAATGMPALERSAALQHAASLLSQGFSLHQAMRTAGYLAAQSSALHLSGVVSDAQIARLLADHYCRTVGNTELRQMGAAVRDRDVWMVLATPAFVPTAKDAAVVTRQMLQLVNQARVAGARCGNKYFAAVLPLKQNAQLAAAALTHSQDMAASGAFDHIGRDGSTSQLRVERAGYGPHRIVGENIAAGPMTALQVVQGWLASPAHCENIMDGRFVDTGIAFASNPHSAESVYWTQDFAAPR